MATTFHDLVDSSGNTSELYRSLDSSGTNYFTSNNLLQFRQYSKAEYEHHKYQSIPILPRNNKSNALFFGRPIVDNQLTISPTHQHITALDDEVRRIEYTHKDINSCLKIMSKKVIKQEKETRQLQSRNRKLEKELAQVKGAAEIQKNMLVSTVKHADAAQILQMEILIRATKRVESEKVYQELFEGGNKQSGVAT